MPINRLVIASPAGNVTGIVFGKIPQSEHPVVARSIQKRNPIVEQVIFAQERNGVAHGQMAGGEFCANAARALGYVMNAGLDGMIKISMSGTPHPVVVTTKPGYATLTMTTTANVERKDWRGGSVPIVHLEGISHALIYPSHPQAKSLRKNNKADIHIALGELGIRERLASGLIIAQPTRQGWKIKPYVFVRAVETLFAESSCASASCALALHQNRSIDVLQPSRKKLVITQYRTNAQSKISVGGSMKILWDAAKGTTMRYVPVSATRPITSPSQPKIHSPHL